MTPARITPPYRIILRELAARDWTQQDLADRSGIGSRTLARLLDGTAIITPQRAIALAKAFGTSEEFWLNLIANYERQKWMGGDRDVNQ